MTQSHQRSEVWDRRTRGKSGYEKPSSVQELHLHQLEKLKTSSSSVPCLEMTGTKRSVQGSWGTLTGNGKDPTSKPRKVLMQIKGNNTRTLAKSNSLPPIYSPRTSTTSICSAKTSLSSWGVECQEPQLRKKANISSTITRMDRALFNKQKQGCQLTATAQLICSGLAVFYGKEHVQNQTSAQRQDNKKTSDAPAALIQSLSAEEPQGRFPGVEPSNPSANDREVLTERMEDSAAHPLSDLAIDIDPLSSQKKENEGNGMIDNQEYYTNQRITAWVVKVNASLFSPSNHDFPDPALEEQDVETIKIIYGQD